MKDIFGFVRQRQNDRDRPGYETSESYKARARDTITWVWLDDIGLVDRPGQYIRTKQEKLRGLNLLRDYVQSVARRLGEIT